jgi:hypothetical protein
MESDIYVGLTMKGPWKFCFLFLFHQGHTHRCGGGHAAIFLRFPKLLLLTERDHSSWFDMENCHIDDATILMTTQFGFENLQVCSIACYADK